MLLNWERARQMMEQNKLQAVVGSLAHNVFYLSDFDAPISWAHPGMALAVLPLDQNIPAAVITADVEVRRGNPQTWMPEIVGYKDLALKNARHLAMLERGELVYDPPVGGPSDLGAALALYLKEHGLAAGRVGFDEEELGMKVVRAGLADLQPVAANDLLRWVRMLKTPQEIALMKSAARKNELAQLASIEAVAAGATYAEAQRVYFASLLHMGGQGLYMVGNVARPGSAGGLESQRPSQPGDTAYFDSLGGYKHYQGDVGRTAIVGPPSREQIKRHTALRKGWAEALKTIQPGQDTREVAARVMRVVRAEGAEDYLTCNPHCVGLEHIDNPHPRGLYEPFVLEVGMVINIDMPYKALEIGMMHTEDTVLITENGIEALTSNDDRLFVIENGSVSRMD